MLRRLAQLVKARQRLGFAVGFPQLGPRQKPISSEGEEHEEQMIEEVPGVTERPMHFDRGAYDRIGPGITFPVHSGKYGLTSILIQYCSTLICGHLRHLWTQVADVSGEKLDEPPGRPITLARDHRRHSIEADLGEGASTRGQ
jgi:hypothetical protein